MNEVVESRKVMICRMPCYVNKDVTLDVGEVYSVPVSCPFP